MKSTKKDEGNLLFKKQKYKEAIECYKQYVSKQHDDNCKAYSNMALSYFKLKQYQQCVKACQGAVQLQPQFQKPYFRMFQAYREINDCYGMVIAASKFCKLSKQEKQIKMVEKQLIKIKQQLRYNYNNKQPMDQQQNKIIDQIVATNHTNRQTIKTTTTNTNNKQQQHNNNNTIIQKQFQMCKQSRWQIIVKRTKQNKRNGLNQAMRFINLQCHGQEEREKYKKLYSKLLKGIRSGDKQVIGDDNSNNNNKNNNISNNNNNNQEESDSSLQQPQIEQLQKYAQQQKLKQIHSINSNSNQQQQQNNNHSTNITTTTTTINNNNNHTIITSHQQQQQQQQQHISQQHRQQLFQQHINTKLTKAQDPFITLYQCLSNILTSTQLTKQQKASILQQCPKKVKKFTMLMKSYSGKQKLSLEQLFIQQQLHYIWLEKYVVTTTTTTTKNK